MWDLFPPVCEVRGYSQAVQSKDGTTDASVSVTHVVNDGRVCVKHVSSYFYLIVFFLSESAVVILPL